MLFKNQFKLQEMQNSYEVHIFEYHPFKYYPNQEIVLDVSMLFLCNFYCYFPCVYNFNNFHFEPYESIQLHSIK